MTKNRELRVEDFDFDGPLGCQGAEIERVGRNHFRVRPGHAPEHPDWANMVNFRIKHGARGNNPRMDVFFPGATKLRFNDYSYSWSYDGESWRAVHWEKGERDGAKGDTLRFPVFTEDTVYVGHQVPMSYEYMVSKFNHYENHPMAHLKEIGKSLEGRPVYRLTVTADQSDIPYDRRRAHYFASQHPGEHNAQWRMLGMIEWLLSGHEDACNFLTAQTAHFLVMMCPDAPSKGWYRVNARGVDMNRTYRTEGADAAEQTHEAFIAQSDLEQVAAHSPLMTVWAHHTWQGVVEPLLRPGSKTEAVYGSWKRLRDHIIAADIDGLIKPLKIMGDTSDWSKSLSWGRGPHDQFGISSFLCEGAGNTYRREDCLAAGRALMQGIARYCLSDSRSPFHKRCQS